jgi:hypothetical protein
VYRDETEIVEQLSLILACLDWSRLTLPRWTMKKKLFLASPAISNILFIARMLFLMITEIASYASADISPRAGARARARTCVV